MERKEKILGYMSCDAYVPLKLEELAAVLDVPRSDRGELCALLDELESEGRIYRTKRNRYCVINQKSAVAAGILSCNAKGRFGFVRTDSGDIFIPHDKLGAAYDGDRVIVRIDNIKNEHGNREGHIESVAKRGNSRIIGVVTGKKRESYMVSPDRRAFFSRVRVAELGGAELGDRVVTEITGYNSKNKPFGRIIAVLGAADSISGHITGIIAEYGIPDIFDFKTAAEADALPQSVDDLSGREDLRHKLIFTIDGNDSRDFDDAVSLETLPGGNSLLGVHIADVTHYVREGSSLDNEALRRGTSVYFPNMVIPMLPQKLSNGICSLNPDVDRLTFSVFMECDSEGNIVNHRISETVIHSAARMTYENVNKILAGDELMCARYKKLVPSLHAMARLAGKMTKRRSDRGAIDFNFPETKIVCDGSGMPQDVRCDIRSESERIIESFMLAANEAVAEQAYWAELPFIYRVHDAPDDEKLEKFNEFIKNFGISFKGKTNIHPKDIQSILDQTEGRPEGMMIAQMALRSLMKACYRDTNSGHFGLAARFYCHFTSPIRRYPDLMIHRILKDYINGRLTEQRISHYESVVGEAAQLSSEREIRAEEAERRVQELMKTVYMRQFLGEAYTAVISSVASFGMFARLENSCEGLIRCENMTEDWFELDEDSRSLIGARTGKQYKVGDKVNIVVSGCDIISRRIEFTLKED